MGESPAVDVAAHVLDVFGDLAADRGEERQSGQDARPDERLDRRPEDARTGEEEQRSDQVGDHEIPGRAAGLQGRLVGRHERDVHKDDHEGPAAREDGKARRDGKGETTNDFAAATFTSPAGSGRSGWFTRSVSRSYTSLRAFPPAVTAAAAAPAQR